MVSEDKNGDQMVEAGEIRSILGRTLAIRDFKNESLSLRNNELSVTRGI